MEIDTVGTVVKTSFVIVAVGIGSGTVLVNQVDKLGLDHNVVATLLGSDWWSGAAVPLAITLGFGTSKTVRSVKLREKCKKLIYRKICFNCPTPNFKL